MGKIHVLNPGDTASFPSDDPSGRTEIPFGRLMVLLEAGAEALMEDAEPPADGEDSSPESGTEPADGEDPAAEDEGD